MNGKYGMYKNYVKLYKSDSPGITPEAEKLAQREEPAGWTDSTSSGSTGSRQAVVSKTGRRDACDPSDVSFSAQSYLSS